MPLSTPARKRAAALAVLTAGGVLLAAGTASAHVTVQPSTAQQGATDQVFAFRVPNEKDTASTVKVQVFFPTDHPIASVLISPVPGWTDQIQTTTLSKPIHTDDGDITTAVSSVTWTGGAIKPGHYQDFTADFGLLPSDTTSLTFKALQTYSDGSVVRWIQPTVAGQAAPDNPAPTLTLTKAATASDQGSATAAPTTAASGGSSDSTARALGIAGIVVGLAGAGFGVLARRRRSTGSATD
jgi:uncharacterized protein YcnI